MTKKMMETDYCCEEYMTSSGKSVVFVYEVYEEMTGGNRWFVGAVVDGAMYYELSMHYYPEDFEKAKELMIQWCEQF